MGRTLTVGGGVCQHVHVFSLGMDGILDWAQARQVARTAAGALPAVDARLDQAGGAVLAAPLRTLLPEPSADSAAVNGYAICGEGPWHLGELDPLKPGHASRIRTGQPVPAHTDAVLAIVDSHADQHADGTVTIMANDTLTGLPSEYARPAFGSGIARAGAVHNAGVELVAAGAIISAGILSLAATTGHDELSIVRPPVVGTLVLGHTLLPSGLPRDGRIRDALGDAVPAFAGRCGARANPAVRAPDTAELLLREIDDANVDILVTTGSTSPEPGNHVRQVLRDLDARWLIDGVAVTPGAQMLLARLADGRFVVGLPGQPQAAVAGMVTLLAPLIRTMRGEPQPPMRAAVLLDHAPMAQFADDTRLAPVTVEDADTGGAEQLVVGARPLDDGGPVGLTAWARATAVAVVPPGAGFAGDIVEIIDLP